MHIEIKEVLRVMKHILSSLIIFCAVFVISVPVAALNTGFQLEDIPEAEATKFLEKTDIQLLDTLPEKGSIISFNVCDGCIAIATEYYDGFNRKYLCIYNLDGQFLKGYSFNTGEFGMDFDGENIFVYFDNEDIAVYLSEAGQVEEVYSIPYGGINYDYWKQHVYAQERKVDGVEYRLQTGNGNLSDFLAPDYAQLVIVDADGNEQLFYDNKTGRNRNKMSFASVMLLILAVQGSVLIYVFRHRRKTGEWPKW